MGWHLTEELLHIQPGLAGHYSHGSWEHPECGGGDATGRFWLSD